MAYWLMKTEPDVFSIHDLQNAANKRSSWDGVRNYQARNFMLQMELGDQVLIYHSSCKQIGIAGLAQVVKKAYPDLSAQDPKSKYYDPKASADNPRWFMVDVEWVYTLPQILELQTLKANPLLSKLQLLQRGSRLSVMPVGNSEFSVIADLGNLPRS